MHFNFNTSYPNTWFDLPCAACYTLQENQVTGVYHMNQKQELYNRMNRQIQSILEDCELPLTAMSNTCAILYSELPDLNWAGFYLMHRGELVLGPFQGKVACMKIAVGKGVCGTAVSTEAVQLVPDVHQFPGHIACDSASQSEIVIPLFVNGKIFGVLDIDSPKINRFDEDDQNGLLETCSILIGALDWTGGLLP